MIKIRELIKLFKWKGEELITVNETKKMINLTESKKKELD